MARPTAPVSGNAGGILTASSSVFRPAMKRNPRTERVSIAKAWQVEAYRQVNICGEARYSVALLAAMAGRAEIGVSEPQTLARKAVWVTSGPEVDAFAELAPTVRERSKLVRDYVTHMTIAGECYLVARERVDTDPPGFWRNGPIWEIVSVTEIQRIGDTWSVRHDNGNYVALSPDDPVIRMWNPDPSDRREAWSPFRSLLPTLREIEWLTKHIFAQVQSRLMSAGVWFLPDNLTFPPPPVDAVEGGAEALSTMNDAEKFLVSLAASSMTMLEDNEVSFPTVVMADPVALDGVDQRKLIQFWSEIDDKAMILRSDAVRRFALGMDMPPEQILGASGVAVSGSAGSAGSSNHWSVWAQEEQTISAHIEPALDLFTATLTSSFLRLAVEGTDKVLAYDTASLRLRQDRSKEAIEWYDRGVLKAEVALRECGFDPESDAMSPTEHREWLLNRIVSGSATPEQMQAAFLLLTGSPLPVAPALTEDAAPGLPGSADRSLKDHPYEGPPREDHEHNDAPYSAAIIAAAEVLTLRALEKAGNVLLNSGKRGRDKDRSTPAHFAHVTHEVETLPTFDFSLSQTVFGDLSASKRSDIERRLKTLCASLYAEGVGYTREALVASLEAEV